MGANASTVQIDSATLRALRTDSRGEEIISYDSVKELEAVGRARIAELEAELAQSQSNLVEKEDELERTQRLLCKLEGAVEQQARDADLEQDRISRMEAALAQQATGTEEKMSKLLLAVAGERNRADMAEAELAKVQEKLQAEEQRRHEAEEKVKNMEELVADLHQRLLGAEESDQKLAASQERFTREANKRVAELEEQLRSLRQEREEALSTGDGESSQMVRELQQQFAEEVAKRMDVQNRLLEKDKRLREVQEELVKSNASEQPLPTEALREENDALKSKVTDQETKCADYEAKLKERDTALTRLKHVLAEELKSRMAAQQQVAEKEKQISNMQMANESSDLSKEQQLQTQVIEKTREACELAQQLADELTKRQDVQFQLLQKERAVCELQTRVLAMERAGMDGSSRSVCMNGIIGLPSHEEEQPQEEEPDDEKSPRSPDEEPSPKGIHPNTPPTSARQSNSGSVVFPIAWKPAPAMPGTTVTTTTTESFGRMYTPPAFLSMGADAVARSAMATSLGGASMRGRLYVSRSPGASHHYSSSGKLHQGSGTTSPHIPPGQQSGDKHARRLRMASRTFA